MGLKLSRLPEEKVHQMIDALKVWSQYEDLGLEVNLLSHLWLYRTSRFSSLETNKESLKEVQFNIECLKSHLDLVLEDITQYQLDPECEKNE